MAKTKYGKYIISELKAAHGGSAWNPPIPAAGKGKGGRVLYLDSNNVPGGFLHGMRLGNAPPAAYRRAK